MFTDASQSAELERLEAENADLRAQVLQSSKSSMPHDRRLTIRRVTSVILIIIGAISLALAVPAMWTRSLLLDTDRYTETVAPLAGEPAIQQSVSIAAVEQLFTQGNVENRIQEALPPRAAFLAPTLSDQLRSLSLEVSNRALDTEAFQQLWVRANRRLHQAAVPMLRGEQGPRGVIDASEGTLSLDISEIVRQLKAVLVDRGIDVAANVPDNALGGEVVLFQSDGLAAAQGYVRTLETLAIALPLVALAGFVLGIGVAPAKRKAALWSGVAILAAMVVLAVSVGLLRTTYLDSVDRVVLSRDAAVVFFDTMVRFLKTGVRVIAAGGLLLVVGAWLAGPSRIAVAVRSGFTHGLAQVESAFGVDVAHSAEWTRQHRLPLYLVVLVVGGGILLIAETVTGSLALGVASIALIAVILVEMFARADHAGPPHEGEVIG